MTEKTSKKDSRPRDRLIENGPQSLSDAELLAVLLQPSARDKESIAAAEELIAEFGGLRELLCASASAFCAAPGLGEAKYAQTRAAIEIANRYFAPALARDATLATSSDAAEYLGARLGHYPHEVFACLFLDNRKRIIQYEEIFHGTLTASTLNPKEVARRAISHNATSVIPGHNRPAGAPEIGDLDHQISLALKDSLALLDIRLSDYIVVGDREAASLASKGWL